jgi:hypothetical protein
MTPETTLSALTAFYRISGFRGFGALSRERGKASAAISFGPNGSDQRLNLADPPQPQHLSREAEMSQLQVFQL